MHYASSVFEGERAYNGKIFESRRHSERLHFSAGELDFQIPYTVDEIEAAKQEVLTANGLSDAYVRAVAWRGAGEDMGVASARNPVPPPRHRLVGMGRVLRRFQIQGRQARYLEMEAPQPRDHPGPRQGRGPLHDLHHVETRRRSQGLRRDALFMDYRGYVAEATGANIFFVKDGEVHTPDPDCFLNGITRQTVIGMLKDRQIKVHERRIEPAEMESFEQCWLTGTAAEVTPVGQIGDYNFEVGAMTRDIAEAYEKLVRS